MNHPHRVPAPPRQGIPIRSRVASSALWLAITSTAIPILPFVATLAVSPVAEANEGHPRWKDFVIWLMDKKRTPEEDLILRYILSGGSRFTWLDVYAHSMQEQTEALFRRWLDGEGNPRRIPNLGTRPPGNSRA
jgi:hypothetical protein